MPETPQALAKRRADEALKRMQAVQELHDLRDAKRKEYMRRYYAGNRTRATYNELAALRLTPMEQLELQEAKLALNIAALQCRIAELTYAYGEIGQPIPASERRLWTKYASRFKATARKLRARRAALTESATPVA